MDADLIRGSLAMSGRVRRYACWPTIMTQTVGEHCWQIARIMHAIFGPQPAHVQDYVRNHDSGELISGDPPFPVKRDNPDLKAAMDRIEEQALAFLGVELPELTVTEQGRFKVCDLIEMMEHGMHEQELGSQLALPIIVCTEEAAWIVAERAGLPLEDLEAISRYLYDTMSRHQRVMSSRLSDAHFLAHVRRETIENILKRRSES